MPDNIYTVYRITNKVNQKIYIGYTELSIDKRWTQHKSDAKTKKSNRYFMNAINKYGADSFEIEEIYQSYCKVDALDKEKYFIISYRSHVRSVGYNSTTGGESNSPNSESREKSSEAQKKRWEDPKTREKYIESFKAPWTEKQREAILAGKRGDLYEEGNIKLFLNLVRNKMPYKEILETLKRLGIKHKNGFYTESGLSGFYRKIRDGKIDVSFDVPKKGYIMPKDHGLKTTEGKRAMNKIYLPENVAEVKRMKAEGMTYPQISEEFAKRGIFSPVNGAPLSRKTLAAVMKV